MRIDTLWIKRHKNLVDFAIDFDESQLTTVLVGENATGKSNLFEAIISIFRHLDLGEAPPFEYRIDYQCRGHRVQIEAKEAKTFASGTTVRVDGEKKLSAKAFRERKDELLPKNVFAYYSGPSRRMVQLFNEHQHRFYQAQLKGNETDGLRRLFYARLVHSQFVLLSFFSSDSDEDQAFLNERLGITGLESVLFVFRKPGWGQKVGEAPEIRDERDGRFFGARGVVKDILGRIWDHALAPIYEDERVVEGFRREAVTEQHLYLYLPDEASIRALAEGYDSAVQLFKDLESTYISDVIREVRVLVHREGAEGPLGFSELSEGEQQLLTVLGLLRFTKDEESLFLLDEPDTHLNPHWKLRYLQLIEDAVKPDENSQLVIATHSPLTIASLLRSQVQIFERDADGNPRAAPPDVDPLGLGVAGVLTELFGLDSTLDPETQALIDERDRLAVKLDKSEDEWARLRELSGLLSEAGFTTQFDDPTVTEAYEAARQARQQRLQSAGALPTPDDVQRAEKALREILVVSETDEETE